MTTTFADYAAAAEARKDIELAVLGHTHALCEALRQNYIDYCIKGHQRVMSTKDDDYSYNAFCIRQLKQGICDYEFYFKTGRKYHKVILNANGQHSVHCFIDKKTGEVYKSASQSGPAKGFRYDLRLIQDREWLFKNATWCGSYLYRR